MKLKGSNLLGIAVSDREFALAEVGGGRGGKGGRLRKWAKWPVPEDGSLKRPDALGKRLRTFLNDRGFTASAAVVGVPARWLIAERGDVPAGGREQALAVLRLRAERLSGGDEHRLVFDAAGLDVAGDNPSALLVGLDAGRLEQLKKLCAAAGLDLAAVTSTGLALSQTFARDAAQSVVFFGGGGTELVRRRDGRATGLRHLNGIPAGAPVGGVLGPLTGELARALSLNGPGNGEETGDAGGSVVLVGDAALTQGDFAALSDRLGRDVHAATALEALGAVPAAANLNGEAAGVAGEGVWPAVALAGLGLTRQGLPVDFLDPKLAPPPPPRFDRRVVYGALGGVLLVGGLAWLWTSASSAEAEAARLGQAVVDAKPAVTAAEKLIAEVQFGRGFYETRPQALALMSDLAEAFPQRGGIWAAAASTRGDGKSQLQGKADTDKLVLALRDALMSRPAFRDVQLQDLRQATGKQRDWSFSLSFTYRPAPATRPAQPIKGAARGQ